MPLLGCLKRLKIGLLGTCDVLLSPWLLSPWSDLSLQNDWDNLRDELNSVIGWRQAGEGDWALVGRDSSGLVHSGLIRLPNAINGWIAAHIVKQGVVVDGFCSAGNSSVIRWVVAMEKLSGIQSINLDIRSKYPGCKLLADKERYVEHVGDVICGYALLALWREFENKANSRVDPEPMRTRFQSTNDSVWKA